MPDAIVLIRPNVFACSVQSLSGFYALWVAFLMLSVHRGAVKAFVLRQRLPELWFYNNIQPFLIY